MERDDRGRDLLGCLHVRQSSNLYIIDQSNNIAKGVFLLDDYTLIPPIELAKSWKLRRARDHVDMATYHQPEEQVEDMLLNLEEELPQETCPGDTEANAKVNPMLHDVPGVEGEVPKATFLREVMSGKYGSEKRKATDRLRRVAGLNKFKKERPAEAAAAADAFLDEALHPGDMALGLVQHSSGGGSKTQVTVALVLVQHVHLGNGDKRVDALSANDLADAKARVEAHVLPLQPIAGGELGYKEGLGELISLPATMVLAFSPEAEKLADDERAFHVVPAELQSALDKLVDSNEACIADAPQATGTYLPYRKDEQVLFDSARGQELLDESSAEAEVDCTICGARWPSLLMRQHMGFHKLHTPEKMVSTNPCGFCGGDAALCRSWFENGGGDTVNALTKCVLLGGVAGKKPLNYNHKSAKKMSAKTPCTNHLVECARCEPEQSQKRPCFWSYNLATHHAKEHASHPLPDVATISALERECVKAVGIKKGETLNGAQKALLKAELLKAAPAAQAAE